MKKKAEENGWNAIGINRDSDTGYYKKFNKPLKSTDLSIVGKHCDIYIYDPDRNLDEFNPVD